MRIILSEHIEEFFNFRARQAIKKVLHRCLHCKIAKAHHGHKIEALLPADRVISQKTFGITGIEFAGHLLIMVGSNMFKGIFISLNVLPHVLFIWNYSLICASTSFFWLSIYSWGDDECHKPFKRQRSEFSCHQDTPSSTTVLSICSQVSPIPRSSQNSCQIYCSECSLLLRMVGEKDRNNETLST